MMEVESSTGSHLYRDGRIHGGTDEALRDGWLVGKTHPKQAEPLEIQALSVPSGTVILMWTHAAHAVIQENRIVKLVDSCLCIS